MTDGCLITKINYHKLCASNGNRIVKSKNKRKMDAKIKLLAVVIRKMVWLRVTVLVWLIKILIY